MKVTLIVSVPYESSLGSGKGHCADDFGQVIRLNDISRSCMGQERRILQIYEISVIRDIGKCIRIFYIWVFAFC